MEKINKGWLKDVTAIARILSDSDHCECGLLCLLQAKPNKHVHKPKYRQPTREPIAAFNAVIAQYIQETTRRDMGVFLQVIQDAEKQCFTEVPLKQRRPYVSGPTFGIRFWGEIRRMNKAIGPLLRS